MRSGSRCCTLRSYRPRCAGPPRAGDSDLVTSGDVSSALSALTRTYAGVAEPTRARAGSPVWEDLVMVSCPNPSSLLGQDQAPPTSAGNLGRVVGCPTGYGAALEHLVRNVRIPGSSP